jgi:hypothetical protein
MMMEMMSFLVKGAG